LEKLPLKDLIKELVEAHGPSGREDEVARLVRKRIAGKADEILVTPLGSIHAIVHKGGRTRLMLSAPMDEGGVIISFVDENGFARFRPMGALDANACLGQAVRFNDGVVGVIGAERREDGDKSLTLERLFLDFGSGSKGDCPVKVGDFGAFGRSFLQLGRRLAARGMESRVALAVLLETLHRMPRTPLELQLAFTVQSEAGARGAATSAFALDPEVGIALDTTPVEDTPRGSRSAVCLGKGPAIKIRDSGMISDPRIVEWMIRAAEKNRIPYQRDVLLGGTTDARAMQLVRAGVPVGCVSIPCRYVHTASEMVDMQDVENAVKLIVALLRSPVNLG
jgi:putative aminopeptidase FrvX